MGRSSSQWWCVLWARDLVGVPASLSVAAPVWKRHWPEANSFLSGCQPFCNIARGFLGALLGAVTAVAAVKDWRPTKRCRGRGLTQRNLVSTLEQSPARGDTAATRHQRGTAPASETDELTNGNRVHTGMSVHRRGLWWPDGNEEIQPWPRASGLFSRTTGAARGCTGSGCGCGPGPAGRSCRAGAARVAASSLRDLTLGLARCFLRGTG